jgi:peptidoglycan hydrolase-like protein with peptidoglycan-binding domain
LKKCFIKIKNLKMKLLKILIAVVFVATNTSQVLAFDSVVTEITSAPESYLSNINLDVSDGCTLITRALKRGDNHPEVLELGKFLKAKGYFKGTPSNRFTVALERALSDYQLNQKIFNNSNATNLGVVTTDTRAKISEQSCKARDIARPATSCVFLIRNLQVGNNDSRFTQENRMLQAFLVRTGYLSSTFVTGHFGPLTRQAVARFQFDNGIIASMSSDAAGIVGPRTREFIIRNTCGSATTPRTTEPTNIGYSVSATTRSNVQINTNSPTQILRLTLRPREQNAQINSVNVQIQTATSTNPSDFIDSLELLVNNRIVSRARAGNIFTPVAGQANNYTVTLNGSVDMLSRNEDANLIIRVVPKSTALTTNPAREFTAFIPENGLNVQFSINGNVRGIERWGRPDSKSTFKIGTVPVVVTPVDPEEPDEEPGTPPTTSTTTPTTTTRPAPTVRAPQLNFVSPATGSFGQDLVLRGTYLNTTQTNRIKIVNLQTGAERMLGNFVSRNGRINFKFPNKNAEFLLPRGKISGMAGAYRIYVITNGQQSNWVLYRVRE